MKEILKPSDNSGTKTEKITSSHVKLSRSHLFQVALLSIYCALAITAPLVFIFQSFEKLYLESGPDKKILFLSIIMAGVLGSALHGLSRLVHDVGQRKYEPSWSLSTLMRPFEGGGFAFVVFLGISAGLIVLGQNQNSPNSTGYLFFGALSGMFAHRVIDQLRKKFDAMIGSDKEKMKIKEGSKN